MNKVRMKKARLLVTYDCNRNCPGCCNKNWKYEKPKVIKHYNYDEILITGGEPTLYMDKLIDLVLNIRRKGGRNTKIYVYTANCSILRKKRLMQLIDGICLTIHHASDVDKLYKLRFLLNHYTDKSLRLNVFNGSGDVGFVNSRLWRIKKVDWIKDCPLPSDEEFVRLKNLFKHG